MTTSYELSLKLKELGVEQENGEYYWCEHTFTKKILLARKEPRGLSFSAICRAFTLGELVRELPDLTEITKDITVDGLDYYAHEGQNFTNRYTSPEEAAGELLSEVKLQELNQKEW